MFHSQMNLGVHGVGQTQREEQGQEPAGDAVGPIHDLTGRTVNQAL